MPTRKVTPVVGLPQFDGWSHVINSTNPPGSHLVAAFAVSGRQAGNVGRALTEVITDAHIQSVTDFHDLVTNLVEESQQNNCKLFFAAGVFKGPAKGAFATYQGTVMLKRRAKFGQLVKTNSSIQIVQGSIIDDDIFVLATNQTTIFLSEIEQKFLQGYEVDTIITSIVPGIHGQNDSSLSSLAFISESSEVDDYVVSDRVYANTKKIDTLEHEYSPESLDNALPKAIPNNSIDELLVDDSATRDQKPSLGKTIFSAIMGALLLLITWIFSKIGALMLGFFGILKTAFYFIFQKIKGRSEHSNNASKTVVSDATSLKSVKEPMTIASIQGQSTKVPATFNGPTLSNLKPANRKIAMIIIALLIVAVLVVTIFMTLQQRQKSVEAAQLLIEPISQENTSASQRVNESPVESRDIIATNIQNLQTLLQEHQDDGIIVAAIESELATAEALLQGISGREEMASLNVYYDLRLVRSDFISSLASSRDGLAVFVDTQSKNIILLELESKQVRLIDAGQLSEIRDAYVIHNKATLLADGVHSVGMAEDEEILQLIEAADSNNAATILSAYERFIYVLNPEKRHLYRYAENDGEYSEPIGWFKSSQGLDFASIRSIAIDEGVWVATEMGEIKRFLSGEELDFTIQGISEQLSTPVKLVTSDQHQNLYVLEPAKSRVVVLGKDGSFLREIKSPSLASATSIFAEEVLGKAFAVSGSIVFEIPL